MEKSSKRDQSTEEKILEAARQVFTRKGYAATRTRDIAEQAGINLALLNYYFRSKEKLFLIIMQENLSQFVQALLPALNNTETTIEEKVEIIVTNYIDLITQQPNLPFFILSEVRNHPQQFAEKMNMPGFFLESYLVKQLKERKPDLHPLQFIMSVMGLTIFPFLVKNVFTARNDIHEAGFQALMQERKKLIPIWIHALLST